MKKRYFYLKIFGIIGLFFILLGILRIRFAKVEIILVDDLTVPFLDEKKISDFIESINGTILDDRTIIADQVGKKKISFSFRNHEGIKLHYHFEIEIVDTTAPLILMNSIYSYPVDSKIDLVDKIFCGDDSDATPHCFIEGDYDSHTVGEYPLEFIAEDLSGNQSKKSFSLRIYEPDKVIPENKKEKNYTSFQSVVDTYKTDSTKIGIDVSHHQKSIDFSKISAAGVEFMMIRIGTTKGTNGEYILDKEFFNNVQKAQEYHIPFGVYFYSYSNGAESSKRDAKWVLQQLQKYDVHPSLPIAYDWEEWGRFNSYHLSFFGLTSMAESFLEEIEAAGYKGMLYSSKNYLEQVWMNSKYDVWLAHYTKNTNYQGKYLFWQLCENGQIDGIEGVVDINVYYP